MPANATSSPTAGVSPSIPLEQVDDLYCEITVDSIYPDGNSISYTFAWTVDDIPYSGTTATTVYSDDTIPASETTAGEVWECTVTPNDGTEDGYTETSNATIAGGCYFAALCDESMNLGNGLGFDIDVDC